jgi:hypothetical protein
MSVAIAIRLARVLGMTVDYLVGVYDESEMDPEMTPYEAVA